jgi:DNA-binding Lrp family transcriptional regulator
LCDECIEKKIQTNSIISDIKKQFKPIKAYIMTDMYPGIYTRALDEIKKLNYIEKTSVVTSDYDIVMKVNVKNLEQLHKLTSQLQKVKGLEKTNTQIIEKELKSLSSQ